MKIVLQRVKRAEVRVDGQVVGQIGRGILLLAAVEKGDTDAQLKKAADKCMNMRIFEDENGKLNLSALELGLEVLAVSNFTVAGRTQKGRRPSFDRAESPEIAKDKFERFLEFLREYGLRVETGVFQAVMEVELVNDGPVTLIIDIPPKGGL